VFGQTQGHLDSPLCCLLGVLLFGPLHVGLQCILSPFEGVRSASRFTFGFACGYPVVPEPFVENTVFFDPVSSARLSEISLGRRQWLTPCDQS
jgi:hypothetical protein